MKANEGGNNLLYEIDCLDDYIDEVNDLKRFEKVRSRSMRLFKPMKQDNKYFTSRHERAAVKIIRHFKSLLEAKKRKDFGVQVEMDEPCTC